MTCWRLSRRMMLSKRQANHLREWGNDDQCGGALCCQAPRYKLVPA
jgi:hypothetical protein